MILVIAVLTIVVLSNCGILYIIDKRLSNIKVNVPPQNINVKINKNLEKKQKGFTPETKPMNFDNRPLVNPVSEHEIPKQQPIRKYNSNDIPKCSS